MKFKNSSKIILTLLAMICGLAMFACQNSNQANTTVNKSTDPNAKPPTLTDVPVGNAQTPTEAYRMLFAAVKSQDSAKIKSMLSKGTLGLAQMASAQQNKPVEKIIENGFTQTTMVNDYPQMRDERVKDNFGAVEVWNEKNKAWEDLPFVNEDGSWKIAVGDLFSGSYQKPSKGLAEIERENANLNNPNSMIKRVPTNNSSIPKNANIQRLSNTANVNK